MKRATIANYLHQVGQDRPDDAPPGRGNSPFRPRSLHGSPIAQPRPPTPFVFAATSGGAEDEDRPRTSPLNARRPAAPPNPVESLVAREAAKAEEMAARLAEAYARGREEGRQEAQAKLEEMRAADLLAASQQAAVERGEFQRNEYARLEQAIRTGFAEVGENIGAAVARVLAPFLAEEVVKRATDELCRNIARLSAGGAPGLVKIRGPERLLSRLRERIADVPAAIEYVEDNGVEAVVEANATRIVTELRPWADLLASLDA